ncbi:hypothetical protein Pan241w_24260 [Gimesia alba]|uniref:Uncharacterized protein n=1 Tax=Gimesia alba TaxID=2527973 RepID=A0A517REP3_9PLAN|nr:hypothetical protein [Gimesia alba]QDT42343.1 hypothetical protein Pan241w_24260 [Gimesia alba]
MAIMTSFISNMIDFLGWGKPSPHDSSPYRVADVYQGLREQVFDFKSDALESSKPENDHSVRCILMEMGLQEAVVSLLAHSDGTVSLYFSNGGGILGLGQQEGPHRVSQELLQMIPQFQSELDSTSDYSIPIPGRSKLYVFTCDQVLVLDTTEDDPKNDRLSQSPLYDKAQELIYEIRVVDENRKQERTSETEN